MKKTSFWVDALIGFALTLAVAGAYLARAPLLEGLELKAYDMRASRHPTLSAGPDIALIAIDDDSIRRLGRWPWPRTRLAQMIDLLAAAKPKVIGFDILLTEAEQNEGLQELHSLQAKYDALVKSRKIIERGVRFSDEFSSSTVRLDSDSKLRASIAAAGNVVLPMYFKVEGPAASKPEPLPPALSSSAATIVLRAPREGETPILEGNQATVPLGGFLEAAKAVGYDNLFPDFDGVVRRVYPVIKYDKAYYPSFAFQLVARSLGFDSADLRIHPAQYVEIGKTRAPLDSDQSMLVTYSYNTSGGVSSFLYYSFYDVLNGKTASDVFRDKIVILGASAVGVATQYVTPVANSLAGMEIVANVVDDVLEHKVMLRPDWAPNAELGAIAVIGLFIMLLLPRLKALSGAVVAGVLLAAIIGAGHYLFGQGQWVKVTYPALLLAAGYIVIQTKRFIFTEKGKELVEASAIETNKMLGLSFQGQGMLDMAFDKFRLCPLDEVKEHLYNLALDFERKRQYNKAVAVYEHIGAKDPGYKDIQDKMKILKQAAEGAVFGGIGGPAKEGTVLVAGGASKPTLGRYEIEKELGRGAMGIVYLGKDPKINRKVAIKTMMLEEGTDSGSVKETKERFFREAESAGTLNHPNIIRIFDAGEEHDVCYIAMELLDGHDFTQYAAKDKLLPPEELMEHIAKVADALEYAHAQGIVHRDIKPANIMHLKDGSVRVADFGIARITASSKTATGTVMGTPSYMSPEQVAGKKVDGRSDLFSLGVALFELLTGEKPFKGGEGIGTLLFQIANDPEPEPLEVKPGLPPCASRIIHKALKKNPDERYQKGAQMAADLRACAAAVKSGAAGAAPEAAPEAEPPAEKTAGLTPEEIAAAMSMPTAEAASAASAPSAAPVAMDAAGAAAEDNTLAAENVPAADKTLVAAPPAADALPDGGRDARPPVSTAPLAAGESAPADAPVPVQEAAAAGGGLEATVVIPAAAPAEAGPAAAENVPAAEAGAGDGTIRLELPKDA